MYKCDMCACYMRMPNKIGRKDNLTGEHIKYNICNICMKADKCKPQQKFLYIHKKLNHREGFQISSSRHRPKEKK